jgi:hypothetical protein
MAAENDLNMLVSILEDVGVADAHGNVDFPVDEFMRAFGEGLEQAQDARDRAARFRLYAKDYIAMMQAEEQLLYDKRVRMQAALDRVDQNIINVCVSRGVDENGKCIHNLEGRVYKLRAQKNPDSVEVLDVEQLPPSMVRLDFSKFKTTLAHAEECVAGLECVKDDWFDTDSNEQRIDEAISLIRSMIAVAGKKAANSLIAEKLTAEEAVPGAKWAPFSYHVRVS